MPELDKIGNYRIDGMLGRGAIGVVYRAIDHRSGRVVALKTIHLDLFSDEERNPIVARLEREADIGMRLDHPGVVKVLDFEKTDDIAALVMELVEGENLAQHSSGAGLEWRAAVTYARQLLIALAYVHNRGVIHRDVKPANIISPRAGTGSIKLTDFGIAHIAISTLTCAGDVVGTPAYMPPEQLQGQTIDQRADIFSAGATLYALVAGRPPFSGPLASVMQQLLYQPAAPLSSIRSGIPDRLDGVVSRAMAKDPAARFASACEFISALDEAVRPAPDARHFVQISSDDTVVLASRTTKASGITEALETLATLLDAAASAPVTEKRLSEARSLCAALADSPLNSSERSRAIDICVTRGLAPLADIALEAAPLPHRRGASPREDFIAITTLMGICRRLLLDLGANVDPSAQQLAARLQEAVASFASSLSENLAAEDNPDVAAISANFMRLDVLELGLEMLGADEERQSLAATEALLVNQVMARINATFRRYSQTRDMFARFELAVFLTEIEELIVFAERLVDRSTDVASAFQAMGRQTLTEFVRHAGILAQATIDELLQELTAIERRIPAFGGRIKQLGLIYIFATRFDEPAIRAPLHDLSTKLYRLMEKLAGEVVSRLRAALVLNQVSEIRDHVEQIAAMHELAREVGWDELGGRLLAELRNHVVADPSLRNLFLVGAA